MTTRADRVLEATRYGPLGDDVPAKRLGVSQRQQVNQTARRLEAQGGLGRCMGSDGKIVDALVDEFADPPSVEMERSQYRETLGAFVAERHAQQAFKEALEEFVRDGQDADAFARQTSNAHLNNSASNRAYTVQTRAGHLGPVIGRYACRS